jgi:hypothetical protein
VSEKDRWQLTQTLIADRVTEICGDRAKLVFMAVNKRLADLKSKDFPAIAILKANYAGEQPEETGLRSRGIATIGLLVYTRSNTALLSAGEGEEILGLLRRGSPDGLIGFAPAPFSDETGFPMWLQDETFEDHDGGRITQSATYALEIWMTHSES